MAFPYNLIGKILKIWITFDSFDQIFWYFVWKLAYVCGIQYQNFREFVFYSLSFHFLNLCVLNIKNSMDSLTTSYIRKKRFMIKYQRLKKSIEKPLISLSRWQFYQFSSIFNVNNVKSGCLCRHFLHGRLNWCCFDRSSTRSVFRYTRTQIYTYTCI